MLFFENVVITDIVNCNKVILNPSRIFFKSRKVHAFVVFLTGSSEYLYPDLPPIKGEADSFLYLPRGLEYEVRTKQNASCLVINFRTAADIPDVAPFKTSSRNISQIKSSMLSAVNTRNQRGIGWKAELFATIYKIIYFIQQNQISEYVSTAQRERLTPAMEYIESHYLEQDIHISELVKLCRISEKHFTTLFSRCYKTTAKQYIIDKKLDEAKTMLEFSNTTVTDISEYCGFSSVYYFSRLFKQRTGLTPTDYRRTILVDQSLAKT